MYSRKTSPAKHISLLLLIIIPIQYFWNIVNAQTITKPPAEILEVSIKSKTQDWIKILFNEEQLDELEDSTEIKISDDGQIFSIKSGLIPNKKMAQIFFNAPSEKVVEKEEILEIFTTKNGLTGTSEQLTISINDKIIDALCWENSKPTQGEQNDLLELQEAFPTLPPCINSDDIQSEQTIFKSKSGWQVYYPTGDLSNKIQLIAAYPNPPGQDKGQEYITLLNGEQRNIDLTGWQIKIGDKNQILSDITIPAQESLQIDLEKLQLPNATATIQLLDFQNTLIDQTEYSEIPQGHLWTKANIRHQRQEKSAWISLNYKPKKFPITLYSITGTITLAPTINEEFFFEMQSTEGHAAKIIFNHHQYSHKYLSSILTPNTPLKSLITKGQDQLFLVDFHIKSPQKQAQTNANPDDDTTSSPHPPSHHYLLIPIILLTSYLIYQLKPRK